MSDETTHERADFRWLLVGTVLSALQLVYLVSPIDLVPDVIPVLGWLDDLLGLAAAATVTGYGVWRLVRHPALETELASALPSGSQGPTNDYEPIDPTELKRW